MLRSHKFLYSSVLAAVLPLALTACGSSSSGSGPAAAAPAASSDSSAGSTASTPSAPATAKGTVVIASAGFAEIDILSAAYSLLLKQAGYSTSIKVVSNRELYEPALEKGDVAVVPDYAATMTEFLNHKVNGTDATTVATSDADTTVAAGQKLATPLGLKFLQPAKAVDQNGFAVTKKFATANHLTTLSDLAALGKTVKLVAPEECPKRPFCGMGLKEFYGLKVQFTAPKAFDSAEAKKDVTSGAADLGLVGTTDGTLDNLGLVVLKDDKGLQLADNLVPVVGKNFGDDADLAAALNKLAPVLTTDDLAALILKVDSDREKPEDVASAYLKEKGLLTG